MTSKKRRSKANRCRTVRASGNPPRTSEADRIWRKSGSIFQEPMDALMNRLSLDPELVAKLWSEWRKKAFQVGSNQVVIVVQSGMPGTSQDFYLPKTLPELFADPSMLTTPVMLKDFERYFSLFDAKRFEAAGAFPPCYFIWSDGHFDGYSVSQPCLTLNQAAVQA